MRRQAYIIIVILFLVPCLKSVAKDSYCFDKLPELCNPKKIGHAIARQFMSSVPGAYAPEGYDGATPLGEGTRQHYAPVSLWYNSIKFAEIVGENSLMQDLLNAFNPDSSTFGAIALEVAMKGGSQKAMDLGLYYADRQWSDPVPTPMGENGNYTMAGQLKFMRKKYTPQTHLWIDDIYMITTLQSQAFRATGERKYIDRAGKAMILYLNTLQRPDGLFYHATDVPFVWGQGNGWMAAGMSVLLKYLPLDSPFRPKILSGYQKMMSALLEWQREDGLWGQIINDPEFWAETSGSAMFTYAFIEGIKYGWLEENVYGPAARKAWMALCSHIDCYGNLSQVCEGTNHINSREWYMNQAQVSGAPHGQAAMLLICNALLEPFPARNKAYEQLSISNHPRLYFSEKDFRHLRQVTFGNRGNRYVRNISMSIIAAADSLAMHGEYPYRKDASGRRILENCSRPVLRSLFQTSYAYKITGKKKYLDRAISLLETVCAYPDWNPSHYLDVAELALGVALAYDWLYWEIPSELRDRVADKLIHEAMETPIEPIFIEWCYEVNNRNQVCNAGLAIAALAVWEKAPILCRDVLESSIARNRLAMESLYAPDGIYDEGAVYWSYGTTFEIALLDALESILGTDYGLSEVPGFDRTPYFEINMFSSTGREQDFFNYADTEDSLTLPGCIWYFVRRSGDSGFLWPVREIYEQPSLLCDKYCDDRLAFITLYEAVHAQINKIAEPDAAPFFGDGTTPLAAFRTGWDKDDLYLAIKGGSASSSHAHMDAGSFVFDAYGTRWACDPPRAPYASTEKWRKANGKKRHEVIWDFFSHRNTSHNTLIVNQKKHSIRGKAHLVKRIDSLDYQGACIDMGEIFAEDLSHAERTAAIVNGCRLEVVDVLETGAAPAHIRWNWVTPAAVTLCPDGIILSKDGVEMKLSSESSIPVNWKIWPLNKDTIGLDPEDFLPCAKGLSIVGFECEIPAATNITLKTVCEKLQR